MKNGKRTTRRIASGRLRFSAGWRQPGKRTGKAAGGAVSGRARRAPMNALENFELMRQGFVSIDAGCRTDIIGGKQCPRARRYEDAMRTGQDNLSGLKNAGSVRAGIIVVIVRSVP